MSHQSAISTIPPSKCLAEIIPNDARPGPADHVLLGLEASAEDLHLGHLVGIDVLQALHKRGASCTILIAQMHAALSQKGSDEEIKRRGLALEFLLSRLCPYAKIIHSHDILKNPRLAMSLASISRVTTLRDLARSLPDDLLEQKNKLTSESTLGSSALLYVLLQILDSHLTQATVIVAGQDQRKIYMRQRETYHKLGWPCPAMIFTPLLTLNDQKISKSNPRHRGLFLSPLASSLHEDTLSDLYEQNGWLSQRFASQGEYRSWIAEMVSRLR